MADNNSEQLERNTENLNRLNEELDKLIGQYSTHRSSTVNVSKAANDLAASLDKSAKAERALAEARKQGYNLAKQSIKQLNEATKSYADGVGKYGEAFESASKAIQAVTGPFGLLGKTIGFVTSMLGQMISDGLKFNQVLYQNYTQIADFGATANISSKELLKLGQDAGVTSGNMEVFTKNANSLGTSLVGLGGSASEGIKAFSVLAKSTDETIAEFTRMGFSTEQVMEMQAKFADQTIKTGGAIARTPKELALASREYISNMQVLAELTGVDVKKQQEAMDLALANENLNAYIADLQRQRAETTDQAEKEKLANIIASTKTYAANVMATDDARTATAKLELIANKTGEIYTKNSGFLIAQNFEIEKINATLRSGKMNAGMTAISQDMVETAKVVRETRNTYGESLYSMGAGSKALMETLGYNIKASEKAAMADKLASMTEEERTKYLQDLIKKQIELKKGEKLDTAAEITAEARQTDLARRKLDDTKNELLAELSGGFIKTLLTVIKNITESLQRFLDWAKPWVEGMIKTLKGWLDALSSAIDDVGKWIRSFKFPGSGKTETTSAASSGTGGVMPEKQTTPQKEIRGIVQSGPGFLVVETDGGERQRREGTRNWRNNNPGNLEYGQYAKSKGAIGSDGRFAVFPTLELGQKAKEDLLFGKNYINLSIADAIAKYAPPSENDTRNYIQQILNATQASPSTILAELTSTQRQAMLQTINRVEGFKEGKVTQARLGGILSGPKTGYPVTMHGTEMVTPLDANSILAKLATTPSAESSINTTNSSISSEMVSTLVNKFDQMINRLDESNYIQSKILTYARV